MAHKFSQVFMHGVWSDCYMRGTTHHMNHLGCPAGEDNKARLYVTVTDDGLGVLFYCHHCQGRGFMPLKKYTTRIKAEPGFTSDADLQGKLQGLYDGCFKVFDPALMGTGLGNRQPIAQLEDVWSTFKGRDYYGMRYQIGETYMDKAGKPHVIRHLRYFLPSLDSDTGEVTGLWIRNHPDSYSKVIVYGNAKKMLFDTIERERTVVIVEDPISAIKLDCLDIPSYSLGGLSVDPEEIVKLKVLYDNVVVWLDNDNAVTPTKLSDTLRVFQMLGFNAHYVSNLPEPKKCTTTEIIQALDKFDCIL